MLVRTRHGRGGGYGEIPSTPRAKIFWRAWQFFPRNKNFSEKPAIFYFFARRRRKICRGESIYPSKSGIATIPTEMSGPSYRTLAQHQIS
jgi:hypothetical protein